MIVLLLGILTTAAAHHYHGLSEGEYFSTGNSDSVYGIDSGFYHEATPSVQNPNYQMVDDPESRRVHLEHYSLPTLESGYLHSKVNVASGSLSSQQQSGGFFANVLEDQENDIVFPDQAIRYYQQTPRYKIVPQQPAVKSYQIFTPADTSSLSSGYAIASKIEPAMHFAQKAIVHQPSSVKHYKIFTPADTSTLSDYTVLNENGYDVQEVPQNYYVPNGWNKHGFSSWDNLPKRARPGYYDSNGGYVVAHAKAESPHFSVSSWNNLPKRVRPGFQEAAVEYVVSKNPVEEVTTVSRPAKAQSKLSAADVLLSSWDNIPKMVQFGQTQAAHQPQVMIVSPASTRLLGNQVTQQVGGGYDVKTDHQQVVSNHVPSSISAQQLVTYPASTYPWGRFFLPVQQNVHVVSKAPKVQVQSSDYEADYEKSSANVHKIESPEYSVSSWDNLPKRVRPGFQEASVEYVVSKTPAETASSNAQATDFSVSSWNNLPKRVHSGHNQAQVTIATPASTRLLGRPVQQHHVEANYQKVESGNGPASVTKTIVTYPTSAFPWSKVFTPTNQNIHAVVHNEADFGKQNVPQESLVTYPASTAPLGKIRVVPPANKFLVQPQMVKHVVQGGGPDVDVDYEKVVTKYIPLHKVVSFPASTRPLGVVETTASASNVEGKPERVEEVVVQGGSYDLEGDYDKAVLTKAVTYPASTAPLGKVFLPAHHEIRVLHPTTSVQEVLVPGCCGDESDDGEFVAANVEIDGKYKKIVYVDKDKGDENHQRRVKVVRIRPVSAKVTTVTQTPMQSIHLVQTGEIQPEIPLTGKVSANNPQVVHKFPWNKFETTPAFVFDSSNHPKLSYGPNFEYRHAQTPSQATVGVPAGTIPLRRVVVGQINPTVEAGAEAESEAVSQQQPKTTFVLPAGTQPYTGLLSSSFRHIPAVRFGQFSHVMPRNATETLANDNVSGKPVEESIPGNEQTQQKAEESEK